MNTNNALHIILSLGSIVINYIIVVAHNILKETPKYLILKKMPKRVVPGAWKHQSKISDCHFKSGRNYKMYQHDDKKFTLLHHVSQFCS